MDQLAADQIDFLEDILISQPLDGSTTNLMPFIPVWNAAQLFSAKVKYLNFQNGSGVRYLTMYGQDIYPVTQQNMFYTFQGLTDDGLYFISAIMPIYHSQLPYDDGYLVDDYLAFQEGWNTYINETYWFLEDQNSDSFAPSLNLLDQMMSSFLIEP